MTRKANMLQWDKCKCHPNSQAHWFNEKLKCDGCQTTWVEHQQNPTYCANLAKTVKTRSSNARKQNTVIPKFRVHWNSHQENWTLLLRGIKQRSFKSATAENVTFIISRIRQEKCKKTGKREVHAWAQVSQTAITFLDEEQPKTTRKQQVSYNFKNHDEFHYITSKQGITEASNLYFAPCGALFVLDS